MAAAASNTPRPADAQSKVAAIQRDRVETAGAAPRLRPGRYSAHTRSVEVLGRGAELNDQVVRGSPRVDLAAFPAIGEGRPSSPMIIRASEPPIKARRSGVDLPECNILLSP
jgi:hypothetical protein